MSLLEVKNLDICFRTKNSTTYAVNDFSLKLKSKQVLGIVGESGSGKSVACQSLLQLLPSPPCEINRGTAFFKGKDLLKMEEKQLRKIRGKEISMIFQDPMSSLNPYMKIFHQVAEPLKIHHPNEKESKEKAILALSDVGIKNPKASAEYYPHQLSGGMRQRAMIAMALINHPKILIADEPTTALDVTIQKQVLDLLLEQKEKTQTSIIFISHDLIAISEICDWIYVMYASRIVESAPSKELFLNPLHSYTRSLLSSIPSGKTKGKKLRTISGLPPHLNTKPNCCSFQERNQIGNPKKCLTEIAPPLIEISPNHYVQNCPGCLS